MEAHGVILHKGRQSVPHRKQGVPGKYQLNGRRGGPRDQYPVGEPANSVPHPWSGQVLWGGLRSPATESFVPRLCQLQPSSRPTGCQLLTSFLLTMALAGSASFSLPGSFWRGCLSWPHAKTEADLGTRGEFSPLLSPVGGKAKGRKGRWKVGRQDPDGCMPL